MNLEQAIGMVQARCGSIPNLATKIGDIMEFEKTFTLEGDAGFLPWFLKRTEVYTLPAGETSLALPSEFLGISLSTPREAVRVDDSMYLLPAIPEQWDECRLAGLLRYQFSTDSINFTLPSDQDRSVALTAYWKTPSLVSSSNTNPWLLYGADMLVAVTAASILADMLMTKEAALQETKAIMARKRIIAVGHAREQGMYQ